MAAMNAIRCLQSTRGFWPAVLLLLGLAQAPAAEKLDRGVVAAPRPEGGVYVGWRLLASDPPDVAFDVYRSDSPGQPGRKLNPEPIRSSCNFVDAAADGAMSWYAVQAAGADRAPELAAAVPVRGKAGGYVPIRLEGRYRAQKVGLADWNGDGRLDYLVKQPDFNTDPYQRPGYWKRSEGTYKLEAYLHDGTFLWR